MAPGQTAFGQSSFQAGPPKAASGVLTNFSSFRAMRYPLLRNAIAKALRFGTTTWQVVHEVSYLRANIGRAETGSANTNRTRLDTTHRGNTVVYLSRDCPKTKNIGCR